jgi:hypothetical protein
MTALAFDIGHHARIPADMISAEIKPRALQILNHLMTLCNPQNPEIWIDQGLIANKFKIHRDTVGRWVRSMEKSGLLSFIGFKNDGRRKRYKIKYQISNPSNEPNLKPDLKPYKRASGIFVGRHTAFSSDDVRQKDRTINRTIKTNKKEQPLKKDSKNYFSSDEKTETSQILKKFGVRENLILKIMKKYPLENIRNQANHLSLLLKQGARINNQAAWLVRAIQENYALPEEVDPQIIKEKSAEKISKRANLITEEASKLLEQGKLEEAKNKSLESKKILNTKSNENILLKIKEAIKNKKQDEKILCGLSEENSSKCIKEAEAEALEKISWMGSDANKFSNSIIFKEMVNSIFKRKALAFS